MVTFLLLNERHSRQAWPIARVVKVFKSKDGIVRSVECKMATSMVKNNQTRKIETKILCP